jgi:5'-3' exonuclease
MGIPYYVASLIKQHKHIQKDVETVEADVLGIDFNCFIHTYLKASNPIGSVVLALHTFLTTVAHAKKVYIAFDGLVPMAKMVQQRYRRFRKSTTTEEFDKHQISPGTPYMKSLAKAVRFMFPEAVVSDTLERGEGEHKIFQWLRSMPAEERRTICIYGLDADLVLIALAQNELGDIRLLRERKDEGFSTFSISGLKSVLPLDLEQYLRMSVLCFGNDFMPNLPMFSLREDGYTRALFYADKDTAHKDERKVFLKRAKDTDRRIISTDGHAIETRYACQLMDGVLDWEPVVRAFWKTMAWTMHYFKTSEVLDWEWYYPYPEAPLMTILSEYDVMTDFEWEHPEPRMTVEDQLQFILPSHSLEKCGLSQKYPDELYDEETETRHPFMRRFAWECDPFVSIPRGQLTSVVEVHPMLYEIQHEQLKRT